MTPEKLYEAVEVLLKNHHSIDPSVGRRLHALAEGVAEEKKEVFDNSHYTAADEKALVEELAQVEPPEPPAQIPS